MKERKGRRRAYMLFSLVISHNMVKKAQKKNETDFTEFKAKKTLFGL